MDFTVKKDDIIDVLSKIQGITSRKSNLAITENIIIKTVDSGISLSATDLETGFKGIYPADIKKEGIMAINAKKFFEIVKSFPEDIIKIQEVDNSWFKIGNKDVEFNIAGIETEDFPEVPIVEDIKFFKIESISLKKMIEKTVIIAAASDEKRAHIIGVNFECIDNEDNIIIRMVSTDGKRLSKTEYKYNNKNELGLNPGKNVLLPKKGLFEISKFLETESLVSLGVKDNNFVIKKDNETIILNLLEGDFPEYKDIIFVGDDNNIIELNKESFKMMLRRMSILTSENYKGVIFKLKNNKFEVKTANPDIGESKEDMKIDFEGEEIEVAFNPKFFIETLNFIESENVFLNLKNNETPCLIQGENDKYYLSVIMPMKI